MALMVLLRHGQSVWNAENRYTGWVDVDLSPKGIIEAEAAGDTLADICFDVVHTSALMRAQRTAAIVMERNRASNNPPVHLPFEGTGQFLPAAHHTIVRR